MTVEHPHSRHLPALRALWQEAFGDTDAFLDGFFGTAFSAQRCRVVLQDDAPVAALYWFDCCHDNLRLAYLYAVATAKEHRGKGLCRMLMRNTHKLLAARGYSGALLVPSEPSLFAFYETLGYRTACRLDELSCVAATEKIDLQKIPTSEYAALRRVYLPTRGVIQEKENLSFLSQTASFYRGKDFLLAARTEKNEFFGIELLGNRLAAPKILFTLGYAHGSFRTPGESRPFAMYLPLSDAPDPKHFGLAFD